MARGRGFRGARARHRTHFTGKTRPLMACSYARLECERLLPNEGEFVTPLLIPENGTDDYDAYH